MFFDFVRLQEDPETQRILADFVFGYLLNGRAREIPKSSCGKLVEYGFAWFGRKGEARIDEPLPLVGAANFFSTRFPWADNPKLKEALLNTSQSNKETAFSRVGAYLLAKAFRAPRKLTDVFQFWGPDDPKDATAELVVLQKTNRGFVCEPVDIELTMPLDYRFGLTADDGEEVVSWFNDPKKSVFCFPPAIWGPGLTMFLRFSNGEVARLVVQFKPPPKSSSDPEKVGNTAGATDSTSGQKIAMTHGAKTPLESLGTTTVKSKSIRTLSVHMISPMVSHRFTLTAPDEHIMDPDAIINVKSLAAGPGAEREIPELMFEKTKNDPDWKLS
ncbi:hypothetical protein FRB91_005338 [Serendipita sp. 411]|nr:hypothetical protein FRB91_005338 [Serendipita sp. 411]